MLKKRLFLLVFLVAIGLRFYQIDSNPKALYGDSLTLVYDAYSILKTGHDQKGEFLPLSFSLGGGRPAGYIYATVPFVALFGPTPLASRMASVLSGIGIVILLYLLGKMLLSESVGLAVAAVATLNPWALSLSRGPFESNFALFLALSGFYSFIKGFKKPYWFIIFGLSFGLSSQTYSTYQLTIPLFTLLLLIWNKNYKLVFNYPKGHLLFLALVIIGASTMLSLYLMFNKGSKDRFQNINIFNTPEIRSAISQNVKKDRELDSLSPSISNQLHIPQINMAAVLAENYFRNFFPSFLFLHGDGEPRHNPAGVGEFFWVDAILLILGIVYLYTLNKQLLLLLAGWILIAPIPTSLVGTPHALRDSFLLPPLLILIGLGLWKLWTTRTKRVNSLALFVLIIIFAIQFVYFLDRFYFISPQKNARFWSYPAKEASILALKNRPKFDSIILSNDIDNMEFAYPVYAKLDPKLVIKQNQNPTEIGEFSFFKYDNVYIGSLPHTRIMQFIKDLPGSVLYIGSDKEQSYLENYTLIRGFDNSIDLIITAKGGVPDHDLPR